MPNMEWDLFFDPKKFKLNNKNPDLDSFKLSSTKLNELGAEVTNLREQIR